ncbi:MAG TPA: UDP-3-O-(3-hydroxymyristoyl)glucosamine N-acyltransferase [Methylomirabilota bacterium]|nr:UDP-3-O-(3-hydroxymyristoyl)glucosamine N-acyltransferase [Methylomirabilota bacterium]
MPIPKTLSELADHVGGKVIGDGSVVIHRVASIDEARAGDITFLSHPRYQCFLPTCGASAVIVAPGAAARSTAPRSLNFLESSDPYLAFAKVLQLFAPAPEFAGGVSPQATVDESAQIGERVTIFAHAFVGARARVGSGSVLYPGVFIGEGAQVGADCMLHPNVVVREGCRLGDRVILHAGVVIGSDGFGYAGSGRDRVKIPQMGIVVVEDDVEIGANTTVDRATLGRTVIGRGVKIDNLVQIAHNTVIGEHTVIAAQAGIAGSSRVGRNVTLAGQVGVVNHVQIGDGAVVGPQSGIAQSVPAGATVSSGLAAAPHQDWLKVMVLLPQLPKLWNRVRALERGVAKFLHGEGKEPKEDAGR